MKYIINSFLLCFYDLYNMDTRFVTQICPKAIKWIINYRIAISQNQIKQYIAIDAMCAHDRHNQHSYCWTIKQSKTIDKIGWDNWLKTDNALGFKSTHFPTYHN